MYDYRNADFDSYWGAPAAFDLYNLIYDSDDTNLDWTYWKDPFMSVVLDFISTKRIRGIRHALGHEGNHRHCA